MAITPHVSTALPYNERPYDAAPIHTEDLPATPQRDRNIPAAAWVEAPSELLHLGDDIAVDAAHTDYKRRIDRWLLWRAGPATGADARYMAIAADDLRRQHTFRLFSDGTGEGIGPSGKTHERFRTWKEDLKGAGGA
jgi:hypothetical protein